MCLFDYGKKCDICGSRLDLIDLKSDVIIHKEYFDKYGGLSSYNELLNLSISDIQRKAGFIVRDNLNNMTNILGETKRINEYLAFDEINKSFSVLEQFKDVVSNFIILDYDELID